MEVSLSYETMLVQRMHEIRQEQQSQLQAEQNRQRYEEMKQEQVKVTQGPLGTIINIFV